MTVVKQRCKALLNLDEGRIIIISDVDGYQNLTNTIKSICQKMMEIDISEFNMTDYDDYVVSCTYTSFVNVTCSIYRMFDDKKFFNNIPSVFFDIFNNEQMKSVYEAIQRRHDMRDFDEMRKYADKNTYEFLMPADYANLSEESRLDHLFANLEIITDNMIAQRFENKLGFDWEKRSNALGKAWIYVSSIDNTFIRPAEIAMDSSMYEPWCEVCRKSYDLYQSMIKSGIPSNVARSVMPLSAAKTVQCGTTLRSWQSFLKYVLFSNFAYLSDNCSELVLQICDTFNTSLITEDMRDYIERIKKDIDEHVSMPF